MYVSMCFYIVLLLLFRDLSRVLKTCAVVAVDRSSILSIMSTSSERGTARSGEFRVLSKVWRC